MTIEITGITKTFGSFTALRDVTLSGREGEFLALLGPSGSGKTTLLRILAGLEFPDSGAILIGGEDVGERSARERQVGFVFQHYALFRHMSVAENVAFGLRVKRRRERPVRAEISRRVNELLHLVQLEGLARRYPSQLSGGQRQRVALARALAIAPRMLLLDEPFGALDAKVRKELRRWLRRLHDEMGLTSIFVTHDQEEALELADRVVVMNEGRIEQIGSPDEVYDQPATPFVYEFLGQVNRFECELRNGKVEVCDATFSVDGTGEIADGPAIAYVRPHDIDIITEKKHLGAPAIIRHLSTAGSAAHIEVAVADVPRLVEIELSRIRAQELGLQVGQPVLVRARHARVFPAGPAAAPHDVTADPAEPLPPEAANSASSPAVQQPAA